MKRHWPKTLGAGYFKGLGVEFGVSRKLLVDDSADAAFCGNLRQQLGGGARAETMQAFNFAPKGQVRDDLGRDTANRAEGINAKPMPADNGMGRCVEVGRCGVGRAVRPGTLNAPCGARGWGVYFRGLSPLFWSEDQERPRP